LLLLFEVSVVERVVTVPNADTINEEEQNDAFRVLQNPFEKTNSRKLVYLKELFFESVGSLSY